MSEIIRTHDEALDRLEALFSLCDGPDEECEPWRDYVEAYIGQVEGELARSRTPFRYPGGTCDAGDCDELATWVVWDDEHGWLPICDRHRGEIEP